jgi:hypothetical protein
MRNSDHLIGFQEKHIFSPKNCENNDNKIWPGILEIKWRYSNFVGLHNTNFYQKVIFNLQFEYDTTDQVFVAGLPRCISNNNNTNRTSVFKKWEKLNLFLKMF